MTSPAQVEANQANTTHSTGPATAAGKATSRLNATRHGLTSQVACMAWEDRDAFNQFCASLVADYRPEGTAETHLAQAIAEDNWRLNRARAIEFNIFALGGSAPSDTTDSAVDSDNAQIETALAQAMTFRDEGKSFALITLYEQRIHRTLQRNIDRLRQMQTERRADRARALEELLDLKEYRRIRKIPEPAPGEAAVDAQPRGSGLIPTQSPQGITPLVSLVNGFVFSPEEIDFAAFRRGRANLLAEAMSLSSSHPFRLFPEAA
jgi:hypothetical protein